MARNDGRIEKGQPLRTAISARAWNRAQEAADRVLGAQPGTAGEGSSVTSAPYTWVYGQSSSAVTRWAVMAITGVAVTPTSDDNADATKQFQSMPVLTLGATSSTTTAWCVAIEPIAANKIGRVAVAGAVQIKASDLPKAKGAPVLWKDSNWALIVLSGGPVRLCKTTAVWDKNTMATLNVWEDGTPPGETQTQNQTIEAVNKLKRVLSGAMVIVGRGSTGAWYLISDEMPPVLTGTFSAPWNKGSNATVTVSL